MPENNPAGRLLELLKAGDKIRNPQNMTIKDAWFRILDVGNDYAEFYRRLAQVHALPGAIDDAVRALPNFPIDVDLFLAPLEHVEAALTYGLSAPWPQFTQKASSSRQALELIADALEKSGQEATISDEQLDELLQKVRDLSDEVAASNIDPDLRLFLSKMAQAMQQAIEDARICGAEALQEVVERGFGAIILRTQTKGAPAEGEPGRGVWDKVVGVLTTILLVVNTATGVAQLGHMAGILAPPPNVEAPPVANEEDPK